MKRFAAGMTIAPPDGVHIKRECQAVAERGGECHVVPYTASLLLLLPASGLKQGMTMCLLVEMQMRHNGAA